MFGFWAALVFFAKLDTKFTQRVSSCSRSSRSSTRDYQFAQGHAFGRTFRWARRFFGGQHLSRGEVCVPATSCAFLCVTPRAQPPVFSLFPSQQGYQRYHCTCSELAPSPNFASASRPPAFCAFACRIGLLSALSHTHSACLRFTEVVGCKSRCVAPCWHVPRGSKGAPPPLALERATGTASAHC